MHQVKLLVLLMVAAACSDKHERPPAPAPAPEVATPVPAPAPPLSLGEPAAPDDAALGTGSAAGAGGKCTSARDCKFVPDESDCMYACTGGICQLRGTTRTEGAGPCYGEMLAQAVMRVDVDPPPPQYLLCDAYAGLHCNRATHVCQAAKAIGAACQQGAECGLDGACDPKRHACEPAPGIGQTCVPGETSCGREGFCDPQGRTCVPRVANGQPCDNLGEQCQSAFCGFAGVGQQKMVCMPRPPLRHCPEVP